jgi:poly-gamma-glutamate synthesis protein (capsule biosynthesis protein)
MTGRGIDQILPCPSDPILHEGFIEDARGYVKLAEQVSGPVPRPVDFAYVWGDALREWERRAPDVRLVNLETSITTSDLFVPKGINYRMHPKNVACIQAAGIDCCALANNHVLDWGYPGLLETLETLRRAGVETAGAGQDLEQAEAPAILEVPGRGRVLIISLGSWSSGIPRRWAASPTRPGVFFFDESSPEVALHVAARVQACRRERDVVVASIHWGDNWGYEVEEQQIALAHELIDVAGIDVVHGHSSHHPKAIEVYRGRPILYGCGDFLNDYEGITGHEEYRGDLVLMYFATVLPATGALTRLDMVPLRLRKLRLNRVESDDALWLARRLTQVSRIFDTRVELEDDLTLTLRWDGPQEFSKATLPRLARPAPRAAGSKGRRG